MPRWIIDCVCNSSCEGEAIDFMIRIVSISPRHSLCGGSGGGSFCAVPRVAQARCEVTIGHRVLAAGQAGGRPWRVYVV